MKILDTSARRAMWRTVMVVSLVLIAVLIAAIVASDM